MRNSSLIITLLTIIGMVVLMSFRYQAEENSPTPHYHVGHAMLITDTLYEGSNSFFAASGNCDNCHGLDPAGIASVDMNGDDINLVDDWRSSMMANSARDPFWRAKVSHEVFINPQHQVELESTCTRCHAPLGNFAASMEGAEHYSFAEMLLDSVALDGVSCLACHQRSPEYLSGHNGNLYFSTTLVAYGQYENPLVTPMFLASGYLPEYGPHIAQAEICGGCHSLVTSTVDMDGNLTGDDFVEQATWHEWLNSSYPDVDITCKTCHMPSLGEQGVILAKGFDTAPRTPFSLHSLLGGNAFMLGLLRDNAENLSLTATPEQFESSRLATIANLQQNSLTLALDEFNRDADTLRLNLLLTNLTGHKLPSGYPSRRMVVHLMVRDSLENILWESGNFNSDYTVVDENSTFEPHHQIISSEQQVQIYEMVMGDVNGDVTTVLERGASHLKDNRLVPEGFSVNDPVYDTTEVVLGFTDPDFNHHPLEGTGTDEIHYHIALNGYDGAVSALAEVYYQSIPPRFLEVMFGVETDAINDFEAMYENADQTPVLMKDISLTLGEYVSLGEIQNTRDWVSCFLKEQTLYYNSEKNASLEIYSAHGDLVASYRIAKGHGNIPLNVAGGMYFALFSDGYENILRKVTLTSR